MDAALALFFLGYVRVASRAFQQKNVFQDRWLSVIPTSYLMAVLDIFTFGVSAAAYMNGGWLTLLPVALAFGTGGWMGCWTAMFLHNRLFRKDDDG